MVDGWQRSCPALAGAGRSEGNRRAVPSSRVIVCREEPTLEAAATPARALSSTRPQVRRGHPLSLSISISGGEETYEDSPSNGERTGKSPA